MRSARMSRGLRLLMGLASLLGAAASPAAPMSAQFAETGLPEVNGWSLAGPLLAPRSEQTVVALDGQVYAIGGYPYTRIPSEVVQVFDVATNQWRYGPPLPQALHHAMGAVVNGKIYVVGGEADGAGTGLPAIFLNTTWELDPAAGVWSTKAPMPTARSGGGAAVLDGKIYVAGGRPPGGNDFAVYDPAVDRWSVLPDVPTQRNHLGIGAMGGKVFVAGGRFGGSFASERTAVLEIYDPSTNEWSGGRPLPSPRGGVASVVANGCLFLIGGEGNYDDPRGLSDENEAYNPLTDRWTSLPPMPTPTHGLVGAAWVNGRIYLPGGSTTQGTASASTMHWAFRPELSCS